MTEEWIEAADRLLDLMDASEEMTEEAQTYGDWVQHLRDHLLDELFKQV